MAELVSRRYATAFFDIAVEENNVETLYNEAVALVESLKTEDDFLVVINHPEVTFEQKLELFKNVFSGKISETFFGLFNIVLEKNREEDILNILQLFIAKCEEYKGIVEAVVVSATELSNDKIEKIKQQISKNLNKQVRISTQIDKSIIGGIVIYVEGKVIDSSIKKYLQDQRNELLSNVK